MKLFLEGLLPRLLPAGVGFKLIPHQGKQDLEKSIPRKLRGWQDPAARFIVVRDQDSGDCRTIKARLRALCAEGGHPETLVRIVCRALEAWYLADLAAVDAAFGTRHATKQDKKKYRTPDVLGTPSAEMVRLVPSFGKLNGAREMGPRVRLDNDRSRSFTVFVEGVRRVVAEGARGHG